ncbi:MAG: metallopeptidase [Candidatus Diapherotrites archaeon]|nr:metallopeptidase [Candidatus Diapherotrites archaeon]
MKWKKEPDVQAMMERLVAEAGLSHVRPNRVFCVRGEGSKSRAVARIWSLPRVFQQCLEIEAAYVIEVMDKKWDRLSDEEKEKTIIHELLHIPKTFSGALVPHSCFGKRMVGARQVEKIWKKMKE